MISQKHKNEHSYYLGHHPCCNLAGNEIPEVVDEKFDKFEIALVGLPEFEFRYD